MIILEKKEVKTLKEQLAVHKIVGVNDNCHEICLEVVGNCVTLISTSNQIALRSHIYFENNVNLSSFSFCVNFKVFSKIINSLESVSIELENSNSVLINSNRVECTNTEWLPLFPNKKTESSKIFVFNKKEHSDLLETLNLIKGAIENGRAYSKIVKIFKKTDNDLDYEPIITCTNGKYVYINDINGLSNFNTENTCYVTDQLIKIIGKINPNILYTISEVENKDTHEIVAHVSNYEIYCRTFEKNWKYPQSPVAFKHVGYTDKTIEFGKNIIKFLSKRNKLKNRNFPFKEVNFKLHDNNEITLSYTDDQLNEFAETFKLNNDHFDNGFEFCLDANNLLNSSLNKKEIVITYQSDNRKGEFYIIHPSNKIVVILPLRT